MIWITKEVIKTDKTYDFQKLETIRSSVREIYNCSITLNETFEEQINLKNEIDKFVDFTRTTRQIHKERKSTIKRKRK